MYDQDVEEFLEHFGVKGMRWGIRNESKKVVLSPKDRAKKRDRNIKRVHKVATTVAAGLYIAALLSSSGNQKASTIKPPRSKSVSDLINARRNVEISSLTRMHKEGKMDADQFKNFSTILNARYDRKVAEALKAS